MSAKYRDRTEAGQVLASHLEEYADRSDTLVLALPRGGVPVAYEVATRLHLPLDVFLVRKLGVPGQEELAMGAIASGGVRVVNRDVIDTIGIPQHVIDDVAAEQEQELNRREQAYRGDKPPPDIPGRTVIIVDDGLATGSTMKAAIRALRQRKPSQIVVAVPVAAVSTCMDLGLDADDVVCPLKPEPFYAIGLWYDDFSQTSDAEVRRLLQQAHGQQFATTNPSG